MTTDGTQPAYQQTQPLLSDTGTSRSSMPDGPCLELLVSCGCIQHTSSFIVPSCKLHWIVCCFNATMHEILASMTAMSSMCVVMPARKLSYCGRPPTTCAAGCVVPELLNGTNHVAWFEAGATIFSKNGIQYLGIPGLINARSILATLIVQVGAYHAVTPCAAILR